jgi:anti-sigma regulatory factor (Ser/Thr protein kinase)
VFDRHAVGGPLADDLILVANELTTNAIEAAALGTDITVEVRVAASHVTMTVENVGPPFAIPDSLTLPPSSHMRGRGLALSRSLAGDLSAERTDDGTRVVAKCARA